MFTGGYQTRSNHASVLINVTSYLNIKKLFGTKQWAKFYKEMFDVAARKSTFLTVLQKNILTAASISSVETLREFNTAKKLQVLFTNLSHGHSSFLKSVPFTKKQNRVQLQFKPNSCSVENSLTTDPHKVTPKLKGSFVPSAKKKLLPLV